MVFSVPLRNASNVLTSHDSTAPPPHRRSMRPPHHATDPPGYGTFGDSVESDILTNYGTGGITTTARFFVALLVCFSYPLQCHPRCVRDEARVRFRFRCILSDDSGSATIQTTRTNSIITTRPSDVAPLTPPPSPALPSHHLASPPAQPHVHHLDRPPDGTKCLGGGPGTPLAHWHHRRLPHGLVPHRPRRD